MRYYLGVDLGGTNIAVGAVDEHYRIVGRGGVKTDLPRPAEEIVKAIWEACRLALSDAGLTLEQIEWVGIGSPGVVNSASGEIEFANNLNFHHVPLRRMVYECIGRPTYLENDANAAAYGEVLAGGARGYQDVVAITLGTGVGGGIIIGGRIYSGYNHAGAELGHVGMFYGGEACSCGAVGCVESFCSASALIRQTKDKMKAQPDSQMWELCGGDMDKVSGRTAFDAMRAGDTAGSEVVRQYCDYLGYAVNSFTNLLQPQIVLIGGGISHEGETLLEPIRQYVYTHGLVADPEKRVRVEAATLGNDAGIIGAAFLGNL
ncbi:MAG: ROK family protein [Provencibacterium sp.]|jgi:glucokinase|nr:ROK family protein [Provencibacterium sp.]